MQFVCDKRKYFFETKIMPIFYVIFIIVSSILLLAGTLKTIMALVFVASFYALFTTVVFKNYVEKITITEDYLEMYAMGKKIPIAYKTSKK